MRKLVGIGTLGLSLAAALVGLTACAENEESLLITQLIVPSDECVFMSGQDVSLSRLSIDTSFGTNFTAVVGLEVVNNLAAVDPGDSNNQIDDSEMQLREAVITVSGQGSSEFTIPIAQESFSGQDTEAVLLDLPFADLANAIGNPGPGETVEGEVEVRVSAFRASNFGLANGGLETSRPYTFPVTVCNGCFRECIPTILPVDDGMGGMTDVEICGFDSPECLSGPVATGGLCGAPMAPVQPRCCDGAATEVCLP